MTCAHKGCDEEGRWKVVANIPLDRWYQPNMMQVDLLLCDHHYELAKGPTGSYSIGFSAP